MGAYRNGAKGDASDASSGMMLPTFHDQRVQYVISIAGFMLAFWNADHAYGVTQFNGSRQPASSLSEKSESSLRRRHPVATFAPSERACVADELRHLPTYGGYGCRHRKFQTRFDQL